MKLECSCGGVAFASRRRFAYRGDATRCRSCGGPGHISVTDDYEEDAVATWHLDAACGGGEHCSSISEKPTKIESGAAPREETRDVKKASQKKGTPVLIYCDRCDGCGWYEGGPTIQTKCEVCKGTGAVLKETPK